jgi:hypothetical protein
MDDYGRWWYDGSAPPRDPDSFYSVVSNNPDGIIRTYTQYGQNTSIWASAKSIKMMYQILSLTKMAIKLLPAAQESHISQN